MHTGNNIIIDGSREHIFEVVRDLERWPERLPHYRYVRFAGKDGPRDIVEMSAYRERIPVSWVSAFESDRDRLELHFEHLSKWTKGMRVSWNLTPTRDATRVEIAHDLKFRFPLLRWLAEPVISNFVSVIATRTLAAFKKFIESDGGNAATAA